MDPAVRKIGVQFQLEVLASALDATSSCPLVLLAVRDAATIVMPCAPGLSRESVLAHLQAAADSLRAEIAAANK